MNKDIYKKIKKAAKIIQRFNIPFIKKSSPHIKNRYDIYQFFYNFLKKESLKQCLTVLVNKFSICDNKIILEKPIGTKSKYGAVYMGRANTQNPQNSIETAIKVMPINEKNKLELDILKKCTKFFVNKKTSHFPIIYNSFQCNNSNDNKLLPSIINKTDYYIYLNELASGDLKMFMKQGQNSKNYRLLINTLIQVFISILTFHKKIKYCHNDSHYGNFLYHKIKPGGYIKYKIDGKYYYLENMGYLWVIWDFGLSDNTYIDYANYIDYKRIIHAFLNEAEGGWVKNNYKIKNEFSQVVKNIYNNLNKFNFSTKNQDDKILKILMLYTGGLLKLKKLPPNATVYNKKAYVL